MTERGNKDKLRRSLSLSKSKKKINVKAGTSASVAAAATTTAPITSFFSSQPPPKLACPLCGRLVPRFKINEHIDLQCQNFERGDSSAASASKGVVPSIQLSPRRNPPKSPDLDPKRAEEEEVEESNTSPYFKKNNLQQAPREINCARVVRTLDLGSLSSKLSRKYHKALETSQTEDKHAPKFPEKEIYSDTHNSSQKENLLSPSLEENKECVSVIDLTTSADTPIIVEDSSCSDKGHHLEHKASKSEIVRKLFTPKLNSSTSKLTKRKKASTTTGKESGFKKKAKYEGSSREPEEVLSRESKANITESQQPEIEAPSTTTTCDPPLSSEETHGKTAAGIDNDSVPQSGAENATSDQVVENSPQVPYYLRNFQTVLQAVLENEDDRALFDQHDMSQIQAFEKLSGILKYHSVIVV